MNLLNSPPRYRKAVRQWRSIFLFDFASTYSYQTAMRIEQLLRSTAFHYRGRLLARSNPQRSGWNDSPFNLYPAKGRYVWRDLERHAKQLNCRFAVRHRFHGTDYWPRGSRATSVKRNEFRTSFRTRRQFFMLRAQRVGSNSSSTIIKAIRYTSTNAASGPITRRYGTSPA